MRQLGNIPPGMPHVPAGPEGLAGWSAALTQALTRVLSDILFGLNRQPECPTFTVATRPAAAEWTGRIIFVSDGGAGAVFQGSNGSAWVNLG